MTNPAVNSHVQACVEIRFHLSRVVPGSGIAGLYGKCISNFIRKLQTVF